jgi:hypothetical protein
MTLNWLLGWWNLIFVIPFLVALTYLGIYTASGLTFGDADADADADADEDDGGDIDDGGDANADQDNDADDGGDDADLNEVRNEVDAARTVRRVGGVHDFDNDVRAARTVRGDVGVVHAVRACRAARSRSRVCVAAIVIVAAEKDRASQSIVTSTRAQARRRSDPIRLSRRFPGPRSTFGTRS